MSIEIEKPKVVVLSGAGISAESGIQTFQAADGLWENHRIEDLDSFMRSNQMRPIWL